MDKKLLKAKHELQKYTTIWAFVGIYSGLILTANGLGYLTKSYTDSNFADFMNGFYTGLFIVIGMVALYNVGKNYKAMKNERSIFYVCIMKCMMKGIVKLNFYQRAKHL